MKPPARLNGVEAVLGELATSLLVPRRDNLVARPWGGTWIRRFKGLEANAAEDSATPFGESFEIAAFDEDAEARANPSYIVLRNGDEVSLPALLAAHGRRILGEAFVSRYGSSFPLLPKILDVKELLSVQGHPAGHTEVYIIIDCEPGATLRLGFSRDIDAAALQRRLAEGLAAQRALVEQLGSDVDLAALQRIVAPWMAKTQDDAALADLLEALPGGTAHDVRSLLARLKATYWHVLDSMNAIAVEPGQVIHNSTPPRFLAGSERLPSAEVHALGNPAAKEILALEIRRPGPTFRAWDNVRFPPRAVDVSGAIAALNLGATRVEDFLCERRPVPERPGVSCSVDSPFFRVEHLAPDRARSIDMPASAPHCLHVIHGQVCVERTADGRRVDLARGESALVPVGFGAYRVESSEPAELVRVSLPDA